MKATIIEVTRDYQIVRDEAGMEFTLQGIARVSTAKVGDTGTMVYRSGKGWGLWFFAPDKKEA